MQKTVLNYLENKHRYEYLKIVKRFGENCKKDGILISLIFFLNIFLKVFYGRWPLLGQLF